MLIATPQLRATPPVFTITAGMSLCFCSRSDIEPTARPLRPRYPDPCSGPCLLEATSQTSSGTQPQAQLHMSVGQDIRVAPTRVFCMSWPRNAAKASLALREARLGRRCCSLRETVNLALLPCQQASAFLACTRPPDIISSQRVYGLRLFFVSARTNKRHHHHHRHSFTVFAPTPSSSSTCAATSA
jgi:hypothetical protein